MSACHLYIFLIKMCIQVFCPFFNQAACFCFLMLNCMTSYILDIHSLLDMSSADIISNSAICIFVLLIVSFTVHKIFFFFLVVLGLHCCMWALSSCRAALHCGAQASHCSAFSCFRAQAPGTRASVVAACGLSCCGSRALEHRLSSCGAWA